MKFYFSTILYAIAFSRPFHLQRCKNLQTSNWGTDVCNTVIRLEIVIIIHLCTLFRSLICVDLNRFSARLVILPAPRKPYFETPFCSLYVAKLIINKLTFTTTTFLLKKLVFNQVRK